MSHIFDALQRSEGESAGVNSPTPSEATELLRRAERRAALKWESAAQARQTGGTETAELAEVIELQPEAPSAPPLEARSEDRPSLNGSSSAHEHIDAFPQFPTIPLALAPQNRLVCFADDDSLAAEAFRLLGVRLQHIRRDRPLHKVLVTSTIPQEGKSMTAANLACTLAQKTQQKVLLLEGDLRRPSLSAEFGIGRNPGICECLQGTRALAKCIYFLEGAGLWILPAGSSHGNALELLQSGRLPAIMDQLTAWFDWVVIDSPPILPLADTSVWARQADGILMVTRQGITEKRHLQRGLEAIEQKKLIGALLNCSQRFADNDYYYRPTDAARPSAASIQ
jgi:capsular exopolysaccharide synthesis family protein